MVNADNTSTLTMNSTTLSKDTTPPCLLLDDLPAELRNNIYEYFFATDDNGDDTIDLGALYHAPSKNILLTCRQVYEEAGQLYQEAYRTYWTNNKFRVHRSSTTCHRDLKIAIATLRDQDLQHIKDLELSRPSELWAASTDLSVAAHCSMLRASGSSMLIYQARERDLSACIRIMASSKKKRSTSRFNSKNSSGAKATEGWPR